MGICHSRDAHAIDHHAQEDEERRRQRQVAGGRKLKRGNRKQSTGRLKVDIPGPPVIRTRIPRSPLFPHPTAHDPPSPSTPRSTATTPNPSRPLPLPPHDASENGDSRPRSETVSTVASWHTALGSFDRMVSGKDGEDDERQFKLGELAGEVSGNGEGTGYEKDIMEGDVAPVLLEESTLGVSPDDKERLLGRALHWPKDTAPPLLPRLSSTGNHGSGGFRLARPEWGRSGSGISEGRSVRFALEEKGEQGEGEEGEEGEAGGRSGDTGVGEEGEGKRRRRGGMSVGKVVREAMWLLRKE